MHIARPKAQRVDGPLDSRQRRQIGRGETVAFVKEPPPTRRDLLAEDDPKQLRRRRESGGIERESLQG